MQFTFCRIAVPYVIQKKKGKRKVKKKKPNKTSGCYKAWDSYIENVNTSYLCMISLYISSFRWISPGTPFLSLRVVDWYIGGYAFFSLYHKSYYTHRTATTEWTLHRLKWCKNLDQTLNLLIDFILWAIVIFTNGRPWRDAIVSNILPRAFLNKFRSIETFWTTAVKSMSNWKLLIRVT